MFRILAMLWHKDIKGHTITHRPASVPDEVIRSADGRPMINVYEQIEFQNPMEHWECSCGEMWI